MTSRERLLAAMRLQEVDRVPLNMRGVMAWDERWVATRHESYRPVIEAVREHGDFCGWWGPGGGILLTASPELRLESRIEPGTDWNETVTTMQTPRGPLTARHLSSNRGLPGMTREFYVKTLDDLERALSVPYEPVRPAVERFFEADKQMGERGIVSCELSNPLAGAHALMGSERLAIWSRTERRAIVNLVGVLRDRLLELVRQLPAAGVGPVFGSSGQEYAVPPLMSPGDFREFCTQMEAPIGEAIHEAGGLLRVHCHGAMSDVLEDFVTIGCNCLHPIEPPPMGDIELAEAKRRVGSRICLEGNLQIGDLYAAPTEEVVEKAKAAIRDGGPRGFILCPTASPHTEVLSDRTVANYLAMIETAACPQ